MEEKIMIFRLYVFDINMILLKRQQIGTFEEHYKCPNDELTQTVKIMLRNMQIVRTIITMVWNKMWGHAEKCHGSIVSEYSWDEMTCRGIQEYRKRDTVYDNIFFWREGSGNNVRDFKIGFVCKMN